MRVLFLADINSSHVQKWVTSLANSGFEIFVFTLSPCISNWSQKKNIRVFYAPYGHTKNNNLVSKLSYLRNVFFLKKCIAEIKPDIVHAHYATSYGLLGNLAGFRPLIISVWGSDVLDFPAKSFIHSYILSRNLKSAFAVCSTSNSLTKEVLRLTGIKAVQIPFGVDTSVFKPDNSQHPVPSTTITIGTIKALESIYRIDLLLASFAMVKAKFDSLNLKLLLVGDGSLMNELKLMAEKLGISNDVVFAGKIAYDHIVDYHNAIDIFVNVSSYESFGVSVLESSACSKPVIVTNTEGLNEVVVDKETGYLVSLGNVNDVAEKLEWLVSDVHLRISLGERGRKFVKRNYEWKNCVEQMKDLYFKCSKA